MFDTIDKLDKRVIYINDMLDYKINKFYFSIVKVIKGSIITISGLCMLHITQNPIAISIAIYFCYFVFVMESNPLLKDV